MHQSRRRAIRRAYLPRGRVPPSAGQHLGDLRLDVRNEAHLQFVNLRRRLRAVLEVVGIALHADVFAGGVLDDAEW